LACEVPKREVDRCGLGRNAVALHDRGDAVVVEFDVGACPTYTPSLHQRADGPEVL
jgi:hypothetical protein